MADIEQLQPINDEQSREVYEWVDSFELSKIKRHIGRDFADGVLVGEIMSTFYPGMISLHSLLPKSSKKERLENWEFLRRKLTRKSFQKNQLPSLWRRSQQNG